MNVGTLRAASFKNNLYEKDMYPFRCSYHVIVHVMYTNR